MGSLFIFNTFSYIYMILVDNQTSCGPLYTWTLDDSFGKTPADELYVLSQTNAFQVSHSYGIGTFRVKHV